MKDYIPLFVEHGLHVQVVFEVSAPTSGFPVPGGHF